MPDSQVEEVKSKVDIVSLIGERVVLKKSGRNLKGLCPFHGEKSPSFFVTPDMQMYKCFGCGASGDVFSFLMNYEGLTFPEALAMLAERAGVVLTKRERTTSELQRDRVLELMHLASEYYHYLLTEHAVGKNALKYLKDRGVTNQSIKDFKIGYSLDSWDGLQLFLVRKKGYTLPELEAAGLIIRRGESNGYYDRFRSRIMFPLTTYAGKIVGFSGRTMDPDAKEAKYINSPETEYYHKSELLFGVNLAKKTIRENNRIIIMEGEFDVISSHQIGLKEAVAIKGSALTDEQASLIRRLTHNVVLALDADAAGQEAIHRGIGVCEKQALNLRVVRITGGKDPDELAKSNPKAWKAAITEADSVYSYLIESACEQFNPTTGEGKKSITQAVMPELIKIEHAVEREFYMKKLAEKLHVSDIALNEELQKTKRSFQLGTTPPPAATATSYSRRELLERQLLGLTLQSSNPATSLAQIDLRWFSEPHLKRLVDSIAASDLTYRGAALVKQLPEAIRPLAEEVFTMQVNWLEETEEAIQNLLNATAEQLSDMWSKQRMVELSHLMSASDVDETKLHELQQEYRALTNRDREGDGGRGNNKSV